MFPFVLFLLHKSTIPWLMGFYKIFCQNAPLLKAFGFIMFLLWVIILQQLFECLSRHLYFISRQIKHSWWILEYFVYICEQVSKSVSRFPRSHLSPFFEVRHWSGRPGFNPRPSHTKDAKMLLDTVFLSIQHYKVRIKGKGEQSRELRSALSYTLVW